MIETLSQATPQQLAYEKWRRINTASNPNVLTETMTELEQALARLEQIISSWVQSEFDADSNPASLKQIVNWFATKIASTIIFILTETQAHLLLDTKPMLEPWVLNKLALHHHTELILMLKNLGDIENEQSAQSLIKSAAMAVARDYLTDLSLSKYNQLDDAHLAKPVELGESDQLFYREVIQESLRAAVSDNRWLTLTVFPQRVQEGDLDDFREGLLSILYTYLGLPLVEKMLEVNKDAVSASIMYADRRYDDSVVIAIKPYVENFFTERGMTTTGQSINPIIKQCLAKVLVDAKAKRDSAPRNKLLQSYKSQMAQRTPVNRPGSSGAKLLRHDKHPVPASRKVKRILR